MHTGIPHLHEDGGKDEESRADDGEEQKQATSACQRGPVRRTVRGMRCEEWAVDKGPALSTEDWTSETSAHIQSWANVATVSPHQRQGIHMADCLARLAGTQTALSLVRDPASKIKVETLIGGACF